MTTILSKISVFFLEDALTESLRDSPAFEANGETCAESDHISTFVPDDEL